MSDRDKGRNPTAQLTSTTTPSSTVSTATTMDPVTMTTTYPPVTSSSEVTSSPGSNTTSQEALQNSVPMRAMPTSVFSLLGGGGGDHSFDAQGWVEVADQRHQRDMQSESSGMDELDTSGQLTSTCKPNPSTGWDVTLNRHQLDYVDISPEDTHVHTQHIY
eukprot:Em0112g12a